MMTYKFLFINKKKSANLQDVEKAFITVLGNEHKLSTAIFDLKNEELTINSDDSISSFDFVIIFSSEVKERLKILPNFPALLTWYSVTDFDNMVHHFEDLKKNGYLDSIIEFRTNIFSLFNTINEAVISYDLDGRLIYISQKAEKLLDISANNLIGKTIKDTLPIELLGNQPLDKFSNIVPKSFDTFYYVKNQVRKELNIKVSPLKHSNGKTWGAMLILRNVTKVNEMARLLNEEDNFHRLIGSDKVMQELYEMIRNVGLYDFPVLIQGESGTGKELISDAIHKESKRKGLFVPVNCGAIPEGTLESELFGHVKGSFTGAIKDKKGRFELANGGTIFLDEIGELPLSMQVKLLRVLQEGVVEPVGSEKSIKIDVRVVSATNKDLKKMVEEGTFREDLYYRLAVVPIDVPPLRDRNRDIIDLAQYFLSKISKKFNKPKLKISNEVEIALLDYNWPGNVRQLQNALQYSIIKTTDGIIRLEHLPPEVSGLGYTNPIDDSDNKNKNNSVHSFSRKPILNVETITQALKKSGGNKAKAARLLNIGRATLYNYINKYPELQKEISN